MRKHKMWTLLIVLSLLAACKQPQSLTPSVSEVAQIKANGTSIRLFCLTNRNGMTIKVTNFAASLTSVSVPDKKGNFEQVVLGFDSLESYLGKHPKFGATVGRFANRIKHGEFCLDNQIFQLEKNSKGNSVHGGSRENGADRLPVSVSRLNEPEYSYTLVKEDVGYYLMAAIAPKHLRCLPGEERIVVSNSPIKKGQVNITHIFETDFQNFPCKNQPQLLPGFWTIGGYKPLDTAAYDWQVVPDKDYWIYGPGMNGSHGTGLLQDQKGARLLYTPLDGSYGDMAITLNVDASKTAGQGFGSATGQYLDLYIKFDTRTLTGYALRIIRTTKYSNAVDFILMKYENGVAEAISQPEQYVTERIN